MCLICQKEIRGQLLSAASLGFKDEEERGVIIVAIGSTLVPEKSDTVYELWFKVNTLRTQSILSAGVGTAVVRAAVVVTAACHQTKTKVITITVTK
jgi:hypothetical protein